MMEETHPTLLPGKQLKQEREKKGLTLDDVARQLRIRKHYLEALEEDNYSLFSSRVYARGYLKKYAEYLMLSSEQCVEAFDKYSGEEENVLSKIPFYIEKKPVTANHYLIKLTGVLIVSLLVVLVGLWWHNSEQKPETILQSVGASPEVSVSPLSDEKTSDKDKPAKEESTAPEAVEENKTESAMSEEDQAVLISRQQAERRREVLSQKKRTPDSNAIREEDRVAHSENHYSHYWNRHKRSKLFHSR